MNEDKMEAKRLRQALWVVYAILGFDTNGDATPDALVSDIAKLVTDAAKSFRAEYDEAIASAPAQPVREPMTDEQIEAISRPFIRELGSAPWYGGEDGIRDDSDLNDFVRAIERHHGITKE